jgi:hypothetical protein
MGNFTSSPGVSLNEIDNTYLSGQPIQVGAAIVGPTVKGPVEIPTVVSSYSEYTNIFGDTFTSGSDQFSYLTSIAAYNYFNYGGQSLLVARVASGSYTSATGSISSNVTLVSGNTSSLVIPSSSFTSVDVWGQPDYDDFKSFTIAVGEANYYISPNPYQQNIFNNSTNIYYTSSGATTNDNAGTYLQAVADTINNSNADFKLIVGITASYASNTLTVKTINGGILPTTISIYKGSYVGSNSVGTLVGSLSGGTANVSSTAFELETISQGAIMNNYSTGLAGGMLLSGSKDNVRFEIKNPNTASGNFDVVLRRGDDITVKPLVLESFNNVNLDPNSPRFISKVIGNQVLSYNSTNNQIDVTGEFPNKSKFVRVKSITNLTPNYLDSTGLPNASYYSYLPVAQSGSFSGATGKVKDGANMYDAINASNTQGLVTANYTNMINLLSNTNDYKFNILSTPGLTNDLHTSAISSIINNTQLRGDNIYILDLTVQSATISDAITQAQSRDNSFATTYWPWVNIVDPGTGKNVWVPASTLIPGVYVNNDKISAPWFAPAGINRGGLNSVQRAKYKLSEQNKTDLQNANINPLATMPRYGVVAFGQKTLQKGQSALDRINVRRLLIELKNYIGQVADNLVFEQNTLVTRNNFLSQVRPYLEKIQQAQGLYAFNVIMDETNNTADVIDRNQLIGQIYIQPSRTVEFVSLDFILQPTGTTFPI